MFAKVFHTDKSSDEFDEFIETGSIPPGNTILAACNGNFTTNLSQKVIEWFQKQGSKEITSIQPGHTFAFIAIAGR